MGKDSNNPIIFESSLVSTPGAYSLKWTGAIYSNSTTVCNGSYDFEII